LIRPGDALNTPLKLAFNPEKKDTGIVFITLKTNAKPQLASFYFKIP